MRPIIPLKVWNRITREAYSRLWALLILVAIVFVAGAIAQGFDYEASYWIFPYSLIGKLAAFFGWFAGSVLLWLEAKRRLGL